MPFDKWESHFENWHYELICIIRTIIKIMCHEITARTSFIMYAVTLDYKGLLLVWAKIIDENFMLGGQGLNVECCLFCTVLRVSKVLIATMLHF